jgi:murein DD-endopeptidase MepM/ murein hydrolase activator NlpD
LRVLELRGSYHGHRAIDFLDPERLGGDPIYAAGAGEVTNVSLASGGCDKNASANAMRVDHGGGVATYYTHLASFSVANGGAGGRGDEDRRDGSHGLHHSVWGLSTCTSRSL